MKLVPATARPGLRFLGKDLLTGPDFFVSYCRADAAAYAGALARRLNERGPGKNTTCDIDQWGAPAGVEVPDQLLRRVLRCQVLLVVCSPRALVSAAVREEIQLFTTTTKRPLLLIDFDDEADLAQASWSFYVTGMARFMEPAAALASGCPTEAVEAQARSALQFGQQRRRIKWGIQGGLSLALGVIAALLLVIGYLLLDRVAYRRQQTVGDLLRGQAAQWHRPAGSQAGAAP